MATLGPEIPPLDEALYVFEPEEIAFLLVETRLDTKEALKKHLLDIQARAYKIYPYPCIRLFSFTKSKISRMPAYQSVLKLGQERQNAIFIDVGCCFGDSLRKAVSDGFPIKGVLGFDIEKNFWDLGHEAFRSTPETFPVPFVKGDIFDPSILELVSPYYDPLETAIPALNFLTSLNPLRGHVSVIYTAAFFHLFNEERQLSLARALAGLLSPEPGTIIFGVHVGNPVKGLLEHPNGAKMFCHSPDSYLGWGGFRKGEGQSGSILKTL